MQDLVHDDGERDTSENDGNPLGGVLIGHIGVAWDEGRNHLDSHDITCVGIYCGVLVLAVRHGGCVEGVVFT